MGACRFRIRFGREETPLMVVGPFDAKAVFGEARTRRVLDKQVRR